MMPSASPRRREGWLITNRKISRHFKQITWRFDPDDVDKPIAGITEPRVDSLGRDDDAQFGRILSLADDFDCALVPDEPAAEIKHKRGKAAHMNHDQTFRAVLIVFFLVVVPIGIYHRFKSQATRETLDRRQEGLLILATLRPLGAAFWVGLIAWMVDPGWMAWSSVYLPVEVRWTGVGVLTVASALLVWTFRCLGRNLTDTVVTRQTHTLVLHGPYRWIRHPFYDSAALLTVAISLLAANWFLFAIGVVVFWLLIVRTRTEEANLLARFGDSYRRYMERTGRFFPRIGANRRGA